MNFKDSIFGFAGEFVDPCLCQAWVATAVIGSAFVGAGASIYGANKAADAQTSAADKSIANSKAMYDTTRGDLSAYRDIGTKAAGELSTRLSDLTTPVSVNPDDFLNSTAYKFMQTQGEKGVTNSSAARGLGTSGAALKGAAAFESGLNSQFYQQNFNNQVTNQTNAYTRLKGLVDTGENAAAQTGVLGNAATTNQNSATIGAGNANAAAANATGSAVSNLAGNIGGYAMYKGMYGNSSGAAPSTAANPYSSMPRAGYDF
jgi:hypothetical protein